MDELQRYIEYLQKSTLTRGSEVAHDTEVFANWVKQHRHELEQAARGSGGGSETIDELEYRLESFTPKSQFDSFTSQMIFAPVLSEVLDAASSTGLPLRRGVTFANLTDTSATPVSRPSSADHLVFAGVGTYAFCNYWAKAVSAIGFGYSRLFGASSFTSDNLRKLWKIEPPLLINPVKLVLYYRRFGSLVGFGVVPGIREQTSLRLELLFAMEAFSLAHEIAHCYFEEKGRPSSLLEEEFECDLYGLTISRAIANRRNNWSAFTGAGAYVFLRSAAISTPSEAARNRAEVQTHPDSRDRARKLGEAEASSPIRAILK